MGVIDLAALITELDANPRYDDSVRRGDNTLTTALLAEIEPGKTIFLEVPVAEVRNAIGNGVRNLSIEEMQSLNFFIPDTGTVDFRFSNTRGEINSLMGGKQSSLNRLLKISTRDRTYGEAFGAKPSLNDVRTAVKQITKAAINQ